MDIAAIFRAVLAPEQERAAEQFAHLKVGDRLNGRVLKMEADGRLLIDLGGFKALADTTLPVQVGQRLTLKVTQMGVPIQLRLEGEPQPTAQQPPHPRMALATLLTTGDQQRAVTVIDRLLNALPGTAAARVAPNAEVGGRVATETMSAATASAGMPERLEGALAEGRLPEPVRQALTQLKAIFDPMPLEAPAAQRTQWVQANVEDRGILFELKMADALEQATGRSADGTAKQAAALPSQAVPSAPLEAALSAKMTPEARAAAMLKAGVDPSLVMGSRTDAEMPSTPDPLKIQAGPHGESEPTDSRRLGSQGGPDPQALEHAQRIIARDLKPHLLVLQSFLGDAETRAGGAMEAHTKDVDFLRQAVNHLTAHVEQQQEQAVRRAGEPNLYQVFTHLLPVKEQQQPVQLKVYYPKKGQAAEDDPQHRVALLLMLDRLGPVRADLAMVDRALRINFYVRDPNVQLAFEEHSKAIAHALVGIFDQIQIATQVSKEKIEQFEGEDWNSPPVGRIDVKA